MPLTGPTERTEGTQISQHPAGFAGRNWFDSSSKSQRSQQGNNRDVPAVSESARTPQNQENDPNTPVNHGEFTDQDDKEDYKDESVYTFCGSCKNHVMTVVRFRVGMTTFLSAGFLCLIGCVAGCCLVPFMVPRFSDVIHSCPNCQIKLGKYGRKFKHILYSE